MGLKVLTAVAKGGKTAWAVTQSRIYAAGLFKTPYVLLPSSTQVDDFKQRLGNQGGALGVYLGTFQDISRVILNRSKLNLIVISETAQINLLGSILENLSLNYYQGIKHKPGFAQTVLAIIRELEAGEIEPVNFGSTVGEINQDGRLGELALIYEEYNNLLLRNNLVDPAGLVWKAVETLAAQPEICPEWDLLIVDGFDDLAPVQIDLIVTLSKLLPDVIVTLTGSEETPNRPIVHKRFNHLRAELEEKQQVEFIHFDRKKNVNKEGLFEELEKILFSSNLGEPLDTQGRIKMVAVPDREYEVRSAFRWIKKLISEGSIEPGQAALIMRNLEPYRKIINKVAQEYQLPVFIRGGLPLEENPAVAAILSLLDLASFGKEGLAWHDVVSLWQSPYFDWSVISPEDALENSHEIHLRETKQLSEIARWGSVIQGLEQWKEAFERLMEIPAGEGKFSSRISVLDQIPTGKMAQQLWEKFGSFLELITPPDDGLSSEVYIMWIENLLGDLNIEDDRTRGLNLFQMALEGGPDLFRRDCQAILRLTGLFREYIASDQLCCFGPTTFRNVLVDLKSEIIRQSYQPSRDGENLIICADCTEVRGVSYKAVALIGLAEGEFPGTVKEDPFLRDRDRILLREKFGFPLRPSTESAEAEFFYEAITCASELLLTTRPRIADNGAPWQPSPYWEELLRTLDISPEMKTSRNALSLEDAASQSELFEVIADLGLENQSDLLRGAEILYPDYFKQISRAEKVINTRLGKANPGNLRYDGGLEHLSEDLQIRYPAEHVWSPSRLENYQVCPFSFFVNYLLGFDKPEPPQEGLDARQLGNIYHHILEDLYLKVSRDYELEELLEKLPDVAQNVFNEAPNKEGFRETAWWHHTQHEILTNIKHSLIVLESIDGSFRFYRAEQKFGIRNDLAPQLDIEVEGKDAYHLRGLVDRVDINDQGRLRIIDYKTSSPFGFDNQAVREGKKLQLPLYALAVQDGLQLGDVQEGFYFHVRSAQPSSFRMSTFWNDGERGSEAAIKNAILKGWQAVSSIQNGIFSPQPPGNGCPQYCPAVDFCWHYQRQIW